jgi:hypothetical protein
MDVEESRVYKTTWFGILIHPSMSWDSWIQEINERLKVNIILVCDWKCEGNQE